MVENDLAAFVERVTSKSLFRVESDLGHGFVRLKVSEAERRQAKQDIRCVEDAVIEMLRNARDAHARSIFLATSKSGSLRRIVMIDDGDGLPADMHDAIFEPRVTSKLDSFSSDNWGVHGRGMALYSIKENAEEARVAASMEQGGTAFSVVFDTASVRERKDQSTPPLLTRGEDGLWTFASGPHNIVRCVAEFSLSTQGACTVFCGSAVEIAATMYAYGKRFARSPVAEGLAPQDVPVSKRLSLCFDAESLAESARSIGLDISLRSAYRILQGEIFPLDPYLATLSKEQEGRSLEKKGSAMDLSQDFRGLKIAEEDMGEFKHSLCQAWKTLAEAYFLESDIEPSVRISRDGLYVTFPVRKQL